MTLECVHRSRWRRLAPDDIHQMAGADDLATMQRQGGKHRLAPQAMHRPRPAGRHDINRPEQPHLHESPVLPRKIDPELKHEPRPSAVRWHSNRLQNVAVGEHGFRGAWPVTVRDQPQARPRTIWTLPATQMSSFGRLWS